MSDHELEDAQSEDAPEVITLNVANDTLQTLSVTQRRLGLRIVPYNEVAVHPSYGALMFEPGAFGEVDPHLVRLRMDHEDPPTGLGDTFSDKPDAPYMEFLVSKTERGNDQLTLASDGVSRGASVGYSELPGRSQTRRIAGRSVKVYPPNSVVLHEVSTTWMPTFADAGVMYVLHKEEKGTGPDMAEAQEAPATGAGLDYDQLTQAILAAGQNKERDAKIDKALDAFEQTIELQRSQFSVPKSESRKPLLKDWFAVTLKKMAGEHIPQSELVELALDDVITSEQPGLVPSVFTADYDDIINQDRPFLNSTREVRPPATGNTMTLPIITTRAVAGSQAGGQKTAVTTTAPKVGTGTFNGVGVMAGADIAVQMILRADRSFLDLLDGEFAEAYALDAETKAIAALLTGYTDSASVAHNVVSGGVIDPEDPNFGEAWQNSILGSARRAPTHIWMSASAVGAFIDAKSPMTNAPLYSQLAAAFTAGGGPGGRLSGLTPVYVPALDTSAVDVIVGPSRGFVWAEDPRIRLQADAPGVAGRDILLVGTLFPAPRYADSFTSYTIGS